MKKIIIMLIAIVLLTVGGYTAIPSNVEAASISEFWNAATSFYDKGSSASGSTSQLASALEPVIGLVSDILILFGNLIFFVSTIFLGIKYMFSASDAKASIKESLVTLLVAATFFYSASTLTTFSTDLVEGILQPSGGSAEESVGSIFKTIAVIGKILAFAAAITLGIKYMLASADAKADLKKSMVPFVIGIAFVFATSSVLTFIAEVMRDALS